MKHIIHEHSGVFQIAIEVKVPAKKNWLGKIVKPEHVKYERATVTGGRNIFLSTMGRHLEDWAPTFKSLEAAEKWLQDTLADPVIHEVKLKN